MVISSLYGTHMTFLPEILSWLNVMVAITVSWCGVIQADDIVVF